MIPVLIAASVVGGVGSTVIAQVVSGKVPAKEALANTASALHAAVSSNPNEVRILQWERRHGSRPSTIQPATVTVYPSASQQFLATYYNRPINDFGRVNVSLGGLGQLAGFVEIMGQKLNGVHAGEVFATLASLEGGRNGGGSLRGHNPGNFKWARSRDSGRPAFFLVDRANSPAFYPAFDTWDAGCSYWLATLFGQANFRAAVPLANAGDLRGFTAAIGAGGYAESYRDRNVMVPRYIDRVKAGALAGALVRDGLLEGYRYSGNELQKSRLGQWVRA